MTARAREREKEREIERRGGRGEGDWIFSARAKHYQQVPIPRALLILLLKEIEDCEKMKKMMMIHHYHDVCAYVREVPTRGLGLKRKEKKKRRFGRR